jgi:death-on-curing protein
VTEPRWLTRTVILAIHADQIRSHGGSAGLRDPGLLDSALSRPRNRLHYKPESDLFDLAAAYGFGLATNHPTIDGNKRIAFQAMYVFLGLNRFTIDAPEEAAVAIMMGVASGNIDESDLTSWLRGSCVLR